MTDFNLLTDRWIPVSTANGVELYPLGLWNGAIDIIAPPMTRLAILRLMMAVRAWEDVAENELENHTDWFNLDNAFQIAGLPESSARSARSIIEMIDGNSPAFDPLPHRAATNVELAQALVTAGFCDRGGLKARIEGLPISAQCPFHVGKRVQMKRGDTLVEIIRNNPVQYDGNYQPPWVTGMEYPDHEKPQDELELILWPWRRLQIHGDGITIAPGAKISKDVVDPWVIDKASLKHMRDEPTVDYEITALVLNQASPIAAWVR